jgi:F0F1-type ATP synthase membrane subunit b/b'
MRSRVIVNSHVPYWLPCHHVIYTFSFLGLINKPNWPKYAEMFDESGFEIYTSRALVEVEEDQAKALSRDIQAKLNMSKTLDL